MPGKKKPASHAYIPDNKVRFTLGGATYFSLLLQLIEAATETIHLQVYIFEPDETGQQVADALIAAARRKVSVYLLADGYGSQNMHRSFISRLREGGVHFRFFEPLFRSRSFYVGRRLHHKVLVVDARYALVTGINIGDKYNDKPGQPAWLDFAVCVEGEVAAKLCQVCRMTWKNFRSQVRLPSCSPATTFFDFAYQEICDVRIRRNDWVRRRQDIARTYGELLRGARSRVIILSSYFLPGYTVRQDIKAAVKRGVKVVLIVCSRMDVPLVKDAERFMYQWLLRHKVEVYEYEENMMHGKLATCDEEWMTIGSFNVNDVSARASMELNLDIKSKSFTQSAIRTLEKIVAERCVRVHPDNFARQNGLFSRLKYWFAFKFLRLLFIIFTFYMKQEKRNRK